MMRADPSRGPLQCAVLTFARALSQSLLSAELSAELRAELSAELERKLQGLVPDTAKARAATTTVAVAFHAHIAEGIEKEVKARRADALAVGSHGRNALLTLLLGSVAEHVVKHCSIPVLIVPHGK